LGHCRGASFVASKKRRAILDVEGLDWSGLVLGHQEGRIVPDVFARSDYFLFADDASYYWTPGIDYDNDFRKLLFASTRTIRTGTMEESGALFDEAHLQSLASALGKKQTVQGQAVYVKDPQCHGACT
jgi:hypothetical protein